MLQTTIPGQVVKIKEAKIPAVFFRITGGEGHADQAKGLFRSWLEITQALIEYAGFGPSIGVDKVDFAVYFEDGFEYGGTMEVGRTSKPNNDVDVAQHIYEHIRFNGGLITELELLVSHPHLTWQQYQEFITSPFNKGKDSLVEMLETYEIPPHSFTENPELRPRTKQCNNCGNIYNPEYIDLGRCGRCQLELDERIEREERRKKEQAEKEADPLYPVLQAGQHAVNKKIAQLLRERSGKAWSVKGSRGTASSYSAISAPPRRLSDVGGMTPEDQRELSNLLGTDSLVHKQGESVEYSTRWHYLKAARGDFEPNWEENYRLLPEHATYILNSLLEAPKTPQELIDGYDRHRAYSLDHWNIHNHLFILAKRGEVGSVGDEWRISDARQEKVKNENRD
jgi:hypothetical protein